MKLDLKLVIPTFGLATALAACGETSASPLANSSTNATVSSSSTDAFPVFSAYAGHYTGTWNDNTFNTTGSMAWDISVDSGTHHASIKVAAGGNFFGGSGASPETITLTGLAQGAVSGQTTSFGSLSGTVTPSGAINVSESNIPGGSIDHVTATGQFSGNNKITLQYTVYFVGGGSTATGTVTLNKS